MAISQIAQPFLIGTASWTRGQSSPAGQAGTAQQITPLANIPAGALIYVAIDVVQYPAIPYSITDSAGNPYAAALAGSYLFANDPSIAVWCAQNVSAVTTSGNITITPKTVSTTNFQEVNATVVCIPSGVVPSGAADKTGNGFTTGKNLVITTGELAYGGEMAIAYWAATNQAGVPLPSSDWNSIAQVQGLNNTHWTSSAWKSLASAAPVYARASVPSGGNTGWGGVVVTFKPVVVPTATLSGGGSLTPWHVSSSPQTATLGCGGSILGPAELAPIGPSRMPVFASGYGPLPADLAASVQKPMAYCSQPVLFRAEQHVSQSLPANAWTPLNFDTVLEDPWKGWTGGSGPPPGPSGLWGATWIGATGATVAQIETGLSSIETVTGRSIKTRKVYLGQSDGSGNSPGNAGNFPTTLANNYLQACKDRGDRAVLCYQPYVDASGTGTLADKSALTSSINALKGLGLTVIVVLWQECQDHLTAVQYKNGVAYYRSAVTAAGTTLWYDAAGHTGATAWANYDPGGSLADGYALDFYAKSYQNGIRLDPFIAQANAAGKPVAVFEAGVSVGNEIPPGASTVNAYFGHIQSKISAQFAAGLPWDSVMWYYEPTKNPNNDPSPWVSQIQALADTLAATSGGSGGGGYWLVPWTGSYRITFRYLHTGTSMHWNDPAVGLNGVSPFWESGNVFSSGGDFCDLIPLVAGDYIQFLANVNVSTSTDVSGGGRYASVEVTASQTELPG